MKKVKCANGHFFDAERFSACPICGEESAEIVVTVVREKKNTGLGTKTEPLSTAPNIVDGYESDPSEEGQGNPTGPQKFGRQSDEVNEISITKNDETEKLISRIITEFRSGNNSTETPRYKTAEIKPNLDDSESEPSEIKLGRTPVLSLTDELKASESHKVSPLPKTVSYYDFKEDFEPPVGWIVAVKGPYKGRAFACKTGKNRIGRAADMDICLTEDPKITRKTHAIIIYEPIQKKFFIQTGESSGLTYVNGEMLFEHVNLNPYAKLAIGDSLFVFLPLCGESFSWDEYITEGGNISE